MALPKRNSNYLLGLVKKRSACRLLFIAILFTTANLSAQDTADTPSVLKLLSSLKKYNDVYKTEKLYLHFDRSYYAVGDTAWFKAYVLAGNSKSPSPFSAKLYVDIFGKDDTPVQKLVIPVFDGLAQGYIALDPALTKAGTYSLRAYTNWLQNFGEGHFFYKQFNVGELTSNNWLVAEQHTRTGGADSNQVNMAMRFTNTQGKQLTLQNISLKIQDGNKTIFRTEIVTGIDGTWDRILNLPAKADKRNLTIVAEDVNDKTRSVSFPFYPSGLSTDIDLQFMPEGGSMITGLYNKVAFKAIGEDGLGRDIKGSIIDSKGQEVAIMQNTHQGMGSFMLLPVQGEIYTTKLMVAGKQKTYPLPKAKASGLALRADIVNHPNELYVYLSSAVTDNKRYTLLARSQDSVYFVSSFTLNGEGFFNTRVKTNKFPGGIVNLTVLGPDNLPVAQRSVFIKRPNSLDVEIKPSNAKYAPGDSVSVNLTVAQADGSPAQGSFSVSVIDDGQLKYSSATENIQSHMLLTSELKGHIENPTWYFTDGDESTKAKALDDLLLTQGWWGFDLEKAVKLVAEPKFKAESQISINGKLINLFGKPSVNKKVTVMTTNRGVVLLDTLSNNEGRFKFDNIPLADSATYVIKVHEPNGKSAAVGIEVDEFKPTQLPLPELPAIKPWNVNADTTLIKYLITAQKRDAISSMPISQGTLLKDVTIKDKKITVSGVNGEVYFAEWDIDQKKLFKHSRTTLRDFLEKEYHLWTRPYKFGPPFYWIKANRMVDMIIDGTEVSRYFAPTGSSTAYYDHMRSYLDHYYTDDIKHIYSYSKLVRLNKAPFIEIWAYLILETRSGSGPMLKDHHGLYVYRPLPMQLPKQFYRPKYDVKNTATDLRSTIHWEPNLVTDTDGKAKFSFFAGGKSGTYTINIEGTDMKGNFAVSTQKITIANK